MKQAIETRYYGPTNTRGSRIQAKAWGGSISIPYPHELNTERAHAKAAMALCAKMGWAGLYVAGGSPGERGNVYVSVPKASDWGVPFCDCVSQLRASMGGEGSDWFEIEETGQ
jgi:hypothetical protein